MKFSLALLLTIIATLPVFSQTDSGEVVFAVKKAEQLVTPSLPAYYYASLNCETEEDTITALRVVLKDDTMIFSVIQSRDEYVTADSSFIKVTFKEIGRLRIEKSNEGLWYSELYNGGDESGAIPFVSLNTKIKTPDAFNLLCAFEFKRNCRQQHNAVITGKEKLLLNKQSYNCIKVTTDGTKTFLGKPSKSIEASLAYFKTKVTYLLEEKTGIPLMIKEESSEKAYPYCHTLLVTDVTQ